MLKSIFEKRYHPSQEPAAWFKGGYGAESATGITVTPDSSLQLTTVWACVRALAESSALLPLILYRRLKRGKERAMDHPLYSLLHDSPNPEMTSMEYRETVIGHAVTWGNSFSNIVWGNDGYPRELWPLRPDRMRIARAADGSLRYIYKLSKPDPDGSMERSLLQSDVLHIRGLSGNGIIGYTPTLLAMQAVGLGLAAEEFGARFFGNGASPGGVLEHSGVLGDVAYGHLQKSWAEMHQGLDNSHRIAILEEGMTYKQVGIPPEQAQFLETRKFQVSEIARIFRVPPHKIADLDRATFSNIEQMSIEFVTDSLMPWLTRLEQRMSLILLTPTERKDMFIEHLVDGLLRGDTQTRYQSYGTGRQWGWLSANDIREKENLDPVEGGDLYMVPLNMISADQVGQMPPSMEPQPPDQQPPTPTRSLLDAEQRALSALSYEQRGKTIANTRYRLANSYRRIYKDTASRILRREVQDVKREAEKLLGKRSKRDAGQFSIWLEEFYRLHTAWVQRQFEPLTFAYGELVGQDAANEVNATYDANSADQYFKNYISGYANRHTGISEYRIRQALQQAASDGNLDMLEVLNNELDSWEADRSNEIAQEEPIRFGNGAAIAVYGVAGIEKIRSIAMGKNCPYCDGLNGKVIGINQYMLVAGEAYTPDGADRPLTITASLRHPPYHGGCDCMTIAEIRIE